MSCGRTRREGVSQMPLRLQQARPFRAEIMTAVRASLVLAAPVVSVRCARREWVGEDPRGPLAGVDDHPDALPSQPGCGHHVNLRDAPLGRIPDEPVPYGLGCTSLGLGGLIFGRCACDLG